MYVPLPARPELFRSHQTHPHGPIIVSYLLPHVSHFLVGRHNIIPMAHFFLYIKPYRYEIAIRLNNLIGTLRRHRPESFSQDYSPKVDDPSFRVHIEPTHERISTYRMEVQHNPI